MPKSLPRRIEALERSARFVTHPSRRTLAQLLAGIGRVARSPHPSVPQDLRDAWHQYESVRDSLLAERPTPAEWFCPKLPEPDRARLWSLSGHPDADAAVTALLRAYVEWGRSQPSPPSPNSA